MYKFLIRNGQAVALGLGVLVTAIFLISVFTGLSSAGYDASTDLNALPDETKANIGFFDAGIKLTVFMIIIAGFLALVVFGIINLIKFPKAAMKFLAAFAVLAVIFGILYATSDVETAGKLGKVHQQFNVSDNASKMISGGIKTTLGLAAFSAIAIVLFELRNAFK